MPQIWPTSTNFKFDSHKLGSEPSKSLAGGWDSAYFEARFRPNWGRPGRRNEIHLATLVERRHVLWRTRLWLHAPRTPGGGFAIKRLRFEVGLFGRRNVAAHTIEHPPDILGGSAPGVSVGTRNSRRAWRWGVRSEGRSDFLSPRWVLRARSVSRNGAIGAIMFPRRFGAKLSFLANTTAPVFTLLSTQSVPGAAQSGAKVVMAAS